VNIDDIARAIMRGDRRALAQGITIVENNLKGKEKLISLLFMKRGKAQRIGVAGPPGVGKSTLTMQFAKAYRAQEKTVGIVAVDPTSPFSGGALLGDRIRMTELFNDPGVFIRSMATRGSLGGLAVAATEAGDLLDVAGMSVILFETVGIGQSELDIAEACDTVLLILAPESGDGVQALKAGFMEIADLFIVNKADRDGAEKTVIDISTVIALRDTGERNTQAWKIPVLKTIAPENRGIREVIEHIAGHYNYLQRNELLERRRREQLYSRVKSIVRKILRDSFWSEKRLEKLDTIIGNDKGRRSPYSIARELIGDFLENG